MTVVHPSDEKIASYVWGKLGAPASEPVQALETHVLACDWCVLRAERALEFGQALRRATRPAQRRSAA